MVVNQSPSEEQRELLLLRTSTAYRLSKQNLTLDGGIPFSLKRRPYLIDIFDRRAPLRTILKGAQMGFTVSMIFRAIEDSKMMRLRGILYLFPTDADVIDFSKARFATIAANSAYDDVFKNAKTDSAGLKEIGEGQFIYFRGAGARGASSKLSLSKLKSIPIDHLYLDERDEMQDSRVVAARHRLDEAGSEEGMASPEETDLSTPTLPGYGVDRAYDDSNQMTWHWKCPLCNGWTCLESNWPDCIERPEGRDAYFMCSKCKKELQKGVGEWVAAKDGRDDHLGFWVSQLSSMNPHRGAQAIYDEYEKAEKDGQLGEFYNQVLARAYAEIEDALTEDLVDACIGTGGRQFPRALKAEGPTAMGADPGKRKIHWWVKQRVSEIDHQTLSYGDVESFEELGAISRKFNVGCGVMDQQAETHAVRKFLKNNAGWWGCQYVEQKKTQYDWDPKNRVVTVNRTEALDASHHLFIERRETLPLPGEYYRLHVRPQLCNVGRVERKNRETGDVKMVWIVLGKKNDHLKHAHTYATIAAERSGLAARVVRAQRSAKKQRTGGGRRRNWRTR